jgi:polysaccharide export outer membrane protein
MPMTALPPQVVNKQGTVIFPFIGRIHVAGKTLTQIEKEIVEKLAGKANQPQVMVRLVTNYASTVTVVGEVNSSVLMPLTPKGERLLDAIAVAGGVKAPVNKMTIQVTRAGQTQSLPMETVIQDPRQNIPLLPGDVVTAYYQPLSFTVLGATGKNDEITFEAQGIMLSQALARVGGLSNSLADSKGIFIFRYEDPKTLDIKVTDAQSQFPKDQVPVIYQFDLNDPGTFFASQNFPMKNKDMSPNVRKYLRLVTSTDRAKT